MSHDDPHELERQLALAEQQLAEARALTSELERRVMRPPLDLSRVALAVGIVVLGGGIGVAIGAARTSTSRSEDAMAMERLQKQLLETRHLAVAHCQRSYEEAVRDLAACPSIIDIPDRSTPIPLGAPSACSCEIGDPLCSCE
ncbi:MAG: hypothetical protein JST00_32700 [Deltaproteobacteria bacterium]|nr:hypothetical protein [Deltaproteobacteria bacterium]